MTSEEIRNLQIDGVDVPFFDGYVTVQEGVVTGKLTWSLHVVDYGVSEFVATNQLRGYEITAAWHVFRMLDKFKKR
ncbi:hypothetical protein [Bacillus thuringiensis]